ncbi:hypothetical protein [Chryseobacterium vrystaatense]|uniref:hypothetical protein n=1 Tax=Chryseobacterium vrystaatense TaxID=307480 RepID=UPI000AB03B41|nr:hypothetical protein [Chryseobacterium vrystaatense]
MQDIKASGGAVFKALESLDSGNNAGWVFPAVTGKTLYWVGGNGNWNDRAHWSSTSGGTGGYCVPGPLDDVYFNADSGFTSSGKTVTVNSSAYMHNITFSGSGTAPFLNSTTNPINIYGSSEWQTGMSVSAVYIYYRNNNAPKTVKSNGVPVNGSVFFEEETSVSLMDDLSVSSTITHSAGTLATLNHKVSMKNYSGDTGSKARVLKLGSSDVYITGPLNEGDFEAASSNMTLDAGTSHIHFTGVTGSPKLKAYSGQHYYNISFEKPGLEGTLEGSQTGSVYYNNVIFKGNGKLNGGNEIKELVLTGAKKYTLQAGKIQKITDKLYANGSSCYKLEMVSSVPGAKALLNVMAGATNFDFANIKDINSSGIPLHFGSKSSDLGNNDNISFSAYDPGVFSGFAGQNWSCTQFNNADPASYTLSSAGFFGNPTVKYEWTKLNDPAHTGIISTGESLDMRSYGLGTYHLKVVYSTAGPDESCTLEESVIVGSCIPSMINPGLPIRNY